ncbi:MAG: hypothetical protein PF505_01680 [Vallitaleaceae bacterium]|jgi:hypothetical protein|nr:hypothetical protein [Vallitaleaceae bacterium]
MAKLRAYVANRGKVCDLFKYKEEKQQRIIQEEIRKEVDKQIKRKQQIYTDT